MCWHLSGAVGCWHRPPNLETNVLGGFVVRRSTRRRIQNCEAARGGSGRLQEYSGADVGSVCVDINARRRALEFRLAERRRRRSPRTPHLEAAPNAIGSRFARTCSGPRAFPPLSWGTIVAWTKSCSIFCRLLIVKLELLCPSSAMCCTNYTVVLEVGNSEFQQLKLCRKLEFHWSRLSLNEWISFYMEMRAN